MRAAWQIREVQIMSTEDALAAHAEISRACVVRQWCRLPMHRRRCVDLADLSQEALIACWRAIVEYDSTSRKPLATWIAWRVKCRLVDYLRTEGIFRTGDTTSAIRHPGQFYDGEVFAAHSREIQQIEDGLDADKVLHVITGRDRHIIERWSRGETLLEIGRELGIGQPRASQIKTSAIEGARIALRVAA